MVLCSFYLSQGCFILHHFPSIPCSAYAVGVYLLGYSNDSTRVSILIKYPNPYILQELQKQKAPAGAPNHLSACLRLEGLPIEGICQLRNNLFLTRNSTC